MNVKTVEINNKVEIIGQEITISLYKHDRITVSTINVPANDVSQHKIKNIIDSTNKFLLFNFPNCVNKKFT